MTDQIKLPDVPRALRAEGYESPRYRRIYEHALDGVIPAERGSNGRWAVRADDLAKIAKIMNLPELEAVAA